MTIQAKAGTFTASGAWALNSDNDITGLGFDPQLVLFFDLGSTLDSTAADFNAILGMSDGTNNVCVTCNGKDGLTTTAGSRAIRSDACFYRYTGSIGLRGAFTCAMIADGFRLHVTAVFDVGARQVGYLALGGLSNVRVGASAFPSATGAFTVTTPGFQPTGLIAAMSHETFAINGADDFASKLAFGIATASAQAGLAVDLQDGSASGENSAMRWSEAEILAALSASGGAATLRASFSAFTATGFTLNKLAGSGTGAFIWAAIDAADLALHLETAKTATGSIARSGLGFQPVGLFAFGTLNATATQSSPADGACVCLGAASGATSRVALCTLAPDAQATTDSAEVNVTGALLTKFDRTGADTFTVTGEIDLTSLDSDGYTLDQQDADTALNRFAVLAVGNAAGGGGGGGSAYYFMRRRRR